MDISISLTVIAVLFLINSFFIIAALLRAIRALGAFEKLVEMTRLQIPTVTHDLTQIMGHVRSIVRTAEREMSKVSDSLSAVRDTTRNIQRFEAVLQERIERPLLDITAVLSGLTKGSKVFWNNFFRR